MFLMVRISSGALIYFPSVASLKISVHRVTHILFIFQFSGSVSLIHRWIVDFISGSSSAKRSLSSWPVCLNLLTDFLVVILEMIWFLTHPLISQMRLLRRWVFVPWIKTWGCCWEPTSCFWLRLFWMQLTLFLLSWEDTLCLLSWRGWRYYPGLLFHRIICRPIGSLTCFGVTVKLFMSNSYCETSEMDSAVRTMGGRNSNPSSIILV